MGRDATIYRKNRETGEIRSEHAGRAHYFDAQTAGQYLCYAGQFDGVHSRTEWVRFQELSLNLFRVSLAKGGENHEMVQGVLDLCKPYAETCDFFIHAEEAPYPDEVEVWYDEKEKQEAMVRKVEQIKRDAENAVGYAVVKQELAEKIAKQWE